MEREAGDPEGALAVRIHSEPEVSAEEPSLAAKICLISKKLRSKTLWISFLLGQLCSALLCGTAVTSTYLTTVKGVNCPTAQSFLNYVLLGVVYATSFGCYSDKNYGFSVAFKQRWWKYLILGVIDVEANYLMVKAYAYTSLTSVQLLDCVTIPVVLLLSCAVLHYRFRILHYVGVAMCVAGAVTMVFGDVYTKKSDEETRNALMGDFMVFGGAVLYGFSNVAEEFIVKSYSRLEFLSMLGLFGSLINGIQLVALERHELNNIDWTDWEISACLILFAVFLFGLYSLVPFLMRRAGASIFNLSILSADFYALVIGMTLFNYQFHYFYFIGFILVVAGLITYSVQAPRTKYENAPNAAVAQAEAAARELPDTAPDNVVLTRYALEVYDSDD
ncbi:Solute carrier family 35 member F1 [Hypsibius exemplaris]|uniref:Solute carrier family 35 member F1 n=1 Tax=Hypsibius exemplaris TaxID=2072580 RepID=A0A1W0WKV6_HYPEX|nr:Solute carrier family 35 member F1 [Hypsibius exemplaris]